jgi:hypothetical protein
VTQPLPRRLLRNMAVQGVMRTVPPEEIGGSVFADERAEYESHPETTLIPRQQPDDTAALAIERAEHERTREHLRQVTHERDRFRAALQYVNNVSYRAAMEVRITARDALIIEAPDIAHYRPPGGIGEYEAEALAERRGRTDTAETAIAPPQAAPGRHEAAEGDGDDRG